MISFPVTVKLICIFVFAHADCWFSDKVAHINTNCKDNLEVQLFYYKVDMTDLCMQTKFWYNTVIFFRISY